MSEVVRQLLDKLQFLSPTWVRLPRRITLYIFSSFLFQKLTFTITVVAVVHCRTLHYALGCFQMSAIFIHFFHS